MNTSNRPKAFISYARSDGESFARRLHARLRGEGFGAWLDLFDIPEGARWDAAIDAGLQAADAVLVAVTPGATLSDQVRGEWTFALERDIAIIPLLVAGEEMPRVLAVFQGLDFRGESFAAFSRLAERLKHLGRDYLLELRRLLDGFRQAQAEAPDPRRFDAKIARLEETVRGWESRVADQAERMRSGLEEVAQEAPAPDTARRVPVAGRPPVVVTDLYKGRVTEQEAVTGWLTEGKRRLVSVIGRGGMGKTTLACKVLADIARAAHIRPGGIAYLSTRTTGVSLEQIFAECGNLLREDTRARLGAVWANNTLRPEEKACRLLEALDVGRFLMLLDNLEDLIGPDGRFTDPGIDVFLRELVNWPTEGLAVLITSRVPLPPELATRPLHAVIELGRGLSEAEGAELLRGLDPLGEYGVAGASEEALREVVRRVHGIPRALELVVAILADNPFATMAEVASSFYAQEDVVRRLVEDSYRKLPDPSRRVLEALAVYGKPVPAVAIDFLLQPFAPGLDVPVLLRGLVRTNQVRADRATKTASLHPIDQEFLYGRLPDSGAYALRSLHARAADYFLTVRPPAQVQPTPKSCAMLFEEFDHRVRAGQHDGAANLLDHLRDLSWAGGATQLRQLLARVEGKIEDAASQFHYSLTLLEVATNLGPLDEALTAGNEALRLAPAVADPYLELRANESLGVLYRYLDRPADAIPYFERACAIARSGNVLGPRQSCFSNLCLAYCYTRNLRAAQDLAQERLAWARGQGDPLLIADVLANLALVRLAAGDATGALRCGNESLQLMNAPPYYGQACYILHTVALAHLKLGAFDEALRWFEAAREAATDSEAVRLVGFCQHHAALAKYFQGDFGAALAMAREGCTTLARVGLTAIADPLVGAIEAAAQGDAARESAALLTLALATRWNADLFDPHEIASRARDAAQRTGAEETRARSEEFCNRFSRQTILPVEGGGIMGQ